MTYSIGAISPEELVRFEWARMVAGRWVGDSGLRVLTGLDSDEPYKPLEKHPALFRTFADLEDTEEAFAAFARDYGPLYSIGGAMGWESVIGGPQKLWARIGDRLATEDELHDSHTIVDGWGLPFAVWRGHRRALGIALRLWDALEAGTARELIESGALIIETDTTRGRVYWGGPVISARDLGDALDDARGQQCFPDGTHYPLAKAKSNAAPEGLVRAALAGLTSQMLDSVGLVVRVSATQPSGMRLTFAVDSLLAAMWLQLALAIDGNRTYRPCAECGTWWDATKARSDKLTCGASCRKARQRRGGGAR